MLQTFYGAFKGLNWPGAYIPERDTAPLCMLCLC